MLIHTKAIVLSKLKYRDNDLIVRCYTQQKGILSFMVRGIFKSKKSTAKSAYFQPLSQLYLIVDYKENHSLQSIKETKPAMVYSSLHTNVIKASVVMFLSEVLTYVLKEEEANAILYSYLETTLSWFDEQNNFANFHLLFLLNLTKYLGFYPDIKHIDYPYFNLTDGKFSLYKSTVSTQDVVLLKQLLNSKFDGLSELKIHSKQRKSFLSILLTYYGLHLGDFKKPKSLTVLNQVFN
ncbi:MAG: DNA repair protein RecO [Aestuariibaculum sp.]